MFFRRLAVFICPLLVFFLLEILFSNLSLIMPLVITITCLLLIFLRFLMKEKFLSQNYWRLAVLPLLLFYVNFSLLLFLSSAQLRHIIIILVSVTIGLYLANLYDFYHRADQYKTGSLENISALISLLIFFATAISLNAYSVFLNLPVWLSSLILLILTTILFLVSSWLNKITSKLKLIYLLIFDILILEFFWALSFLPNNFYINGLILTIFYYIIWGIARINLLQQLEKKIVWRYVFIGIVLLVFITLTSSWT